MKTLPLLLLLGTLAAGSTAPGEVVLGDVFARRPTTLNGKWHCIVDQFDTGYLRSSLPALRRVAQAQGGLFSRSARERQNRAARIQLDASPTLNVPGDWNTQDEKLLYYEGSVWYRTLFAAKKPAAGRRLFVYFAAVNYQADVYLNGKKLGQHVGGFTPFAYEITNLVKETGNSLIVRVNNQRHLEGVPTVNFDWWNYGGITRDVLLVETPATFVANFLVRLAPGTTEVIEARVQLDGPQKEQTVKVRLPQLNLTAEARSDAAGAAHIEFPAAKLPLWSPQHPVLHDVEITCDTDTLHDRVGFRTVAVRGTQILLNGSPVFLRGVTIHEENPLRGGRAWSEDDARLLLGWAKDLNCNFVRLAHYPHNEHMARLADAMGIMVWEEIPVYWTIQWTNPDTLKLARQQLADLIGRDQNRASVIVWSVANETPVGDARTEFLKSLVDEARSLDGSRLVSAAMEVRGPEEFGTQGRRRSLRPVHRLVELQPVRRLVRRDAGEDRPRLVEPQIPEAGGDQRVRGRRQTGISRRRADSLQRGVPGRRLPPHAADARQDPRLQRLHALEFV